MVRSTDRPAMTIAVDLGRKATKQTNKTNIPDQRLLKLVCNKTMHDFFFWSPAKIGRHIGIMTPASSLTTASHFWFPIDNS